MHDEMMKRNKVKSSRESEEDVQRYCCTKAVSSSTTSVMVGRSLWSCAHMRSISSTISGHQRFFKPLMEGLRQTGSSVSPINSFIRCHTFDAWLQQRRKSRARSCPGMPVSRSHKTQARARTSQGNFFSLTCHCSISQKTIAHEKTSTLWLYFGLGCQSSGACQLTVPTRLRTIDRVDCFTFARPKSVIFATPLEVIRILEDLQSRWMTDGFLVCKYSRPRAISSMMESYRL